MKNTADLQKENDLLRDKLAQEKSVSAALKEKIEKLLSQRFKLSSEKISPDQLGLFNEAEELVIGEESEKLKTNTVKSHERKARPRVSIPAELPREEVIHDLPDSKKVCPCCEQHLVTAIKPKQSIEKSISSPSLLAFVATQKYADALPLYRQIEMFKRIGVTLDRTNLANWMIKCGELVQPLINLLTEHLQNQSVFANG